MHKLFFIFLLLFLTGMTSGCAKIAHLPQLLTLKAASDNKVLQQKQYDQENENFQKILEAVQANTMEQYPTQKDIQETFGDPVFTRPITEDNGDVVEQWLYRHSTKFFSPEKVYLYFDRNKNLIRWEHIKPKT